MEIEDPYDFMIKSKFNLMPIIEPIRNFDFLYCDGGNAENQRKFLKIRIYHESLINHSFICKDLPLAGSLMKNVLNMHLNILVNESDIEQWYLVSSHPRDYISLSSNPFSIFSVKGKKYKNKGIYLPLILKCKRTDFLRIDIPFWERKVKVANLRVYLQVRILINANEIIDYVEIPFKRNSLSKV